MPTDTSDTPGMVQHPAHGGGMRVALALVAVAQVGVRIELQHHEVLVPRREGTDGAGGQRMLAAQHEREFALLEQRPRPGRRAGPAPPPSAARSPARAASPRRQPEIGLAAELLVVELELLAGGDDRRRPRRRAAAVADRSLEPERDDDRPRGAGIVGVRADGIEKALLGRQILEACGSRLDLLRLAARPALACSASRGIHGQHRLIEQDRLVEVAVAVEAPADAPGRRRRCCRSRCSRPP